MSVEFSGITNRVIELPVLNYQGLLGQIFSLDGLSFNVKVDNLEIPFVAKVFLLVNVLQLDIILEGKKVAGINAVPWMVSSKQKQLIHLNKEIFSPHLLGIGLSTLFDSLFLTYAKAAGYQSVVGTIKPTNLASISSRAHSQDLISGARFLTVTDGFSNYVTFLEQQGSLNETE